jgi:hypothetical protein
MTYRILQSEPGASSIDLLGVNGLDLAEFRTAFGSSLSNPNYAAELDANGDGAVNGLDLAEFRTRFGTSLP